MIIITNPPDTLNLASITPNSSRLLASSLFLSFTKANCTTTFLYSLDHLTLNSDPTLIINACDPENPEIEQKMDEMEIGEKDLYVSIFGTGRSKGNYFMLKELIR